MHQSQVEINRALRKIPINYEINYVMLDCFRYAYDGCQSREGRRLLFHDNLRALEMFFKQRFSFNMLSMF